MENKITIYVETQDGAMKSGVDFLAYKFIGSESINKEYEYRLFILVPEKLKNPEQFNSKKIKIVISQEIIITTPNESLKQSHTFFGVVTKVSNTLGAKKGHTKYIKFRNQILYIYELTLNPFDLNKEEAKITQHTGPDSAAILDELFKYENNKQIKVIAEKDKIEGEFKGKISNIFFHQTNETDAQFLKRFCRYFGANYYYKNKEDNTGFKFSIELTKGIDFSSNTRASEDIFGLSNNQIQTQSANQNNVGFKFSYKPGFGDIDEFHNFVRKNLEKTNSVKTYTMSSCKDISVFDECTIKFPSKQFNTDSEIEVKPIYKNIRATFKIFSDKSGKIGNDNDVDSINIDFISIKKDDNHTFIEVPVYEFLDTANLIPDEKQYSIGFNNPTHYLAVVQKTEDNKDADILNRNYLNMFKAKILDAKHRLRDEIYVYITMPLGGDMSFYKFPQESDVVLVSNVYEAYYLVSYTMQKYRDGKIVDSSIFHDSLDSETKKTTLSKLGRGEGSSSWNDSYVVKHEIKEVQVPNPNYPNDPKKTITETKHVHVRTGSSISLGKLFDYEDSYKYFENRGMLNRKEAQYKLVIGGEEDEKIFTSPEKAHEKLNPYKKEQNTDTSGTANNNQKEHNYQINIDTSGVINMDADNEIFAQSGKDMMLAGDNVYITSTGGGIEIRAPKYIKLAVGNSCLTIEKDSISIETKDDTVKAYHSSIGLDPMNGVNVVAPSFTAKTKFNATLKTLDSSLGLADEGISLKSGTISMKAPSIMNEILNTSLGTLTKELLDNFSKKKQKGFYRSEYKPTKYTDLILKLVDLMCELKLPTYDSLREKALTLLIACLKAEIISAKLAFYSIKSEDKHKTLKKVIYWSEISNLMLASIARMTILLVSYLKNPIAYIKSSSVEISAASIKTSSFEHKNKFFEQTAENTISYDNIEKSVAIAKGIDDILDFVVDLGSDINYNKTK